MAKIISTIDITLAIPPKMREIFPNKEELMIELKAGKPTEVPDYVLDYYTKTRPHVYKRANQNEVTMKSEPVPAQGKETVEEEVFNPEVWLEVNYLNVEEGARKLSREQLLKLCKYMGLDKNMYTTKSNRLIERIVHDVNVKMRQREKLSKHSEYVDE